jgi:alpha-L-fucosidase 2
MAKLLSLMLLAGTMAAGAELKDVEFARPASTGLTLDARIPEAPSPQGAVLLVHGGGWEAGDKRTYINPWFTTLTEAKIAWFTINYRLAPQWKHPAAVEDIEAALKWIRENAKRLRVDPKRIAIMGESAGAHLAALAALQKPEEVAGLVAFYGIYDLPLWFRQRGEVPRNIALYLPDTGEATVKSASPSEFVSRKSPPMLLVHGTADKGVPFEQSVHFCETVKRAGSRCETFLIEGAPHGVENWEKEPRFQTWKPKVVEWLRAVLNKT